MSELNVLLPAMVWAVVKSTKFPVIPVNPEPSPTKEVAVTLPAMLVVPSNKILKASEASTPVPVPFPITKAVFAVLKLVPLFVTEEPLELYCPITKEP